MNISARITEEMAAMPNLDGSKVRLGQVEAATRLIDEGNTIPFIARYRKEATGSLNDEQLRFLGERLTALRNLEDKKQQVLSAIEEQGLRCRVHRTSLRNRFRTMRTFGPGFVRRHGETERLRQRRRRRQKAVRRYTERRRTGAVFTRCISNLKKRFRSSRDIVFLPLTAARRKTILP